MVEVDLFVDTVEFAVGKPLIVAEELEYLGVLTDDDEGAVG